MHITSLPQQQNIEIKIFKKSYSTILRLLSFRTLGTQKSKWILKSHPSKVILAIQLVSNVQQLKISTKHC